jgi:ribosomal protein S18 acetylase RimI-like enzyme
MEEDALELRDDPSPAELQALDDSVYRFNVEATGFADGRALAVFAHDPAGTRLGGLAGHTWGGTCEIRYLYVEEAARGRGLGRRLLESALREAERRGCAQVVLSTHSFQAPGFYKKHGFVEVARIPDYPRGHSQIWLVRKLAG